MCAQPWRYTPSHRLLSIPSFFLGCYRICTWHNFWLSQQQLVHQIGLSVQPDGSGALAPILRLLSFLSLLRWPLQVVALHHVSPQRVTPAGGCATEVTSAGRWLAPPHSYMVWSAPLLPFKTQRVQGDTLAIWSPVIWATIKSGLPLGRSTAWLL